MKIKSYKWVQAAAKPMRKHKIIWRLVALYLVVCMLPILLIGALYRNHYIADIRTKLGVDSAKILSMMDDRQTDALESMENIAGKISISDSVQRLLSDAQISAYERHGLIKEVNQFVTENTLISKLIKNVIVVNPQHEIAYSMGYDLISEVTLTDLYTMAEKTLPLEFVTCIQRKQSESADILLVRIIKNKEAQGESLGYLFVTVSEEIFAKETYEDIYSPEQGEIFIVSDEGIVISSEDDFMVAGEKLADESILMQMKELQTQGKQNFSLELNGEGFLATFCYNSKAKWYAVALIRDSYLTAETGRMGGFIVWLTAIFIGAGLVVMILIASSIVQPINRLVDYCKSKTEHKGQQKIEDTSHDELGYLTNTVNEMVQQIDTQREKERQDSLERKNLEIQMLQAQINPHFLFNTLNSIKMIALMSRVPVVADGLSALASILRSSIINKDEFVTITEEMENIKNYAFIQTLRYGEQFKMEFDVSQTCAMRLVLKFLLQPIVENAILHGIENAGHCVVIRVSAFVQEQNMMIVVADDGAGFDTTQQKNASKNKMSGIGMHNIEQRMKLVYGAQAMMRVESALQQGTTVTLQIPQTEDDHV